MEDVYGKCSNPDCPTTCNKFLQFTSLNQTCRNCGCDSFNHQLLAIFIRSENRLHWLDNSGGGGGSGGSSVAAHQSAGNLKRGGGVVTSQNNIDITAALKQKFSPFAPIVPPPKAKFAPPPLPFVKRMRHQGPQHHHQPHLRMHPMLLEKNYYPLPQDK